MSITTERKYMYEVTAAGTSVPDGGQTVALFWLRSEAVEAAKRFAREAERVEIDAYYTVSDHQIMVTVAANEHATRITA